MLSITELKTGVCFKIASDPWEVLDYQHSKTGRAGAVLRTKIKNLKTGSIINKTFQASDKFEEARLEKKRAQFLYEDNGFVFMDTKNYEQFVVTNKAVGDTKRFFKEGDEIELVFFEDKPIMIELPPKVALIVAEALETEKGNTATAATKKITLETGLEVDSPMFIKKGEKIIVDTRSGSYVSRAK